MVLAPIWSLWIIIGMTRLSSEQPEFFKGRHFNYLLTIQPVRWYVTYKLSYRGVCDLMAERGVTLVHTTVLRRVQCFVPAFEKKMEELRAPCRLILESR
jgi:transposase-like protein